MMKTHRPALLLAALAGAAALAGCSSWHMPTLPEPWVKPYEREKLADPIMALERDPVSGSYLDHVFELREGARGAMGSAGGGCGCN